MHTINSLSRSQRKKQVFCQNHCASSSWLSLFVSTQLNERVFSWNKRKTLKGRTQRLLMLTLLGWVLIARIMLSIMLRLVISFCFLSCLLSVKAKQNYLDTAPLVFLQVILTRAHLPPVGLSVENSVHHHPRPAEEHCSWFLADGLGAGRVFYRSYRSAGQWAATTNCSNANDDNDNNSNGNSRYNYNNTINNKLKFYYTS